MNRTRLAIALIATAGLFSTMSAFSHQPEGVGYKWSIAGFSIKAPDSIDNGGMVPITVEHDEPLSEITIYSADSMALRAKFTVHTVGFLSTRIKMEKTGSIKVEARTRSGRELQAVHKVTIVKGKKPSPASNGSRDIKDIRMKIFNQKSLKIWMSRYPMDERQFIKEIRIWGGQNTQLLATLKTTAWLSDNPFIELRTAEEVAGKIMVEMKDNRRHSATARVPNN